MIEPAKGDETSQDSHAPAPLPIEIPPPPDLSQLPVHILHSGTVETLIGQNEDLMARLKVNVRRNSVLEQQIYQQEQINAELGRANGSLMSQLQVFQEKDRMWRDKSAKIDGQQEGMKGELEMLRAKLRASEERNVSLKRAGVFRRRVQRWVRPMIDRLIAKSKADQAAKSRSDALVSELRTRVSDLVQHTQGMQNQFSKDQAKLVEQYELKYKFLKTDLDKAIADAKLMREKAQRLDSLVEQKALLENRVVFLERKGAEIERTRLEEMKCLQEQTTEFRKEAKSLALDTAAKDAEIMELKKAMEELRAERDRLQDQFESMQSVWSDSQKRMESMKLQSETLNRLNQELSRQLKDQRRHSPSASSEQPSRPPEANA
jgi:chromosome segregation ATPase